MDALKNWLIIHFTPYEYQTTTLQKWMFSQNILFRSSLLLNGLCGIQVPTSTKEQQRPLPSPLSLLFFYAPSAHFCHIKYSIPQILVYKTRSKFNRQIIIQLLVRNRCSIILLAVQNLSEPNNYTCPTISAGIGPISHIWGGEEGGPAPPPPLIISEYPAVAYGYRARVVA